MAKNYSTVKGDVDRVAGTAKKEAGWIDDKGHDPQREKRKNDKVANPLSHINSRKTRSVTDSYDGTNQKVK